MGSSFDLPAKATVLNMIQYNGEYGCTHCLQSGQRVATTHGGSVRVIPYQCSSPMGPPRSHTHILHDAKKAVTTGNPVNGVKVPCYLATLPNYDIVKCTVVDYMHCVLLGVTKMVLGLWFNSKHFAELWYCGKMVSTCDERLAKIKPPIFITRTPRSISKHRNYWKASEYRNWLIFYSIPIMQGILPIDYLSHHILLVQTIFILLSISISSESLHHAEKLIQHYCYKLEHYCDQRYMSANLHCLLHLTAVVRNLGPLFVTSCFGFETLNGQLLYLIKGTQSIGTQVAHAVHTLQVLPL